MPKSKLTTLERFWSHVSPEPNTGCWLWMAGEARGGYAKFKADGKTVVAHKWYWETRNGPVPGGLELDHLCRVRCCVNPIHLEAVTPLVNFQRGLRLGPAMIGRKAQNANLLTCSKGHPFSGISGRPGKKRQRFCKICRAEYQLRYRMNRSRATL